MTIPPTWVRGGAIPISKAARFAGVTTRTFRKWLEIDCELITRKGSPGEVRLVLVDDVEKVIGKRLMSKRCDIHRLGRLVKRGSNSNRKPAGSTGGNGMRQEGQHALAQASGESGEGSPRVSGS